MFPIIPEYVQIEISNHCILKCPLCPKGQGEIKRNNLDIEINIFKSILNELNQYDPRIQLWNYGEPLLHKKIIPLLKIIDNRFNYCSMSTNGQFMTNKLAKTIVQCGITEIIFSIDGIDQKTYEKYRIGGQLNLALENMKKVIKAKQLLNSDIEITIQFLVFKHNFNDIPKLGDFFYPMGVDKIVAKSVMMMYEGNNKELIEISKKYLYLDYGGERYKINKGVFEVKGKDLGYCPLFDNSIIITTDGDFLICCWDYRSDFLINTSHQWKLLKKIVNSDNPPYMCKLCPIRHQNDFGWDWDKVPSVKY